MSSSRKDYVAVAAIIKDEVADLPRLSNGELASQKAEGIYVASVGIAQRIASHFAADNPAFDRARFLKACGVAS